MTSVLKKEAETKAVILCDHKGVVAKWRSELGSWMKLCLITTPLVSLVHIYFI